jgi:hypothetical protein
MIIYDQYFLLFQVSGLILLVAMIGAIVLTLRHRKNVKRQNVVAQMHRDPAKAMELKTSNRGRGWARRPALQLEERGPQVAPHKRKTREPHGWT